MFSIEKPAEDYAASDAAVAAWAAEYDGTVRPALIAARGQARRRFAVLLALVAGTFLVGVWLAHTDRSWWWLVIPVLTVLVAGFWFLAGFRAFESRFRHDLIGRLLRLYWPQGSYDPPGRLARSRLDGAGLFLLTHRHEINDLLRLKWQGLPVALCSAQIFRRLSNKANNVRDRLIFAGTVFEVGCQLPLPGPVVVATESLTEYPRPLGVGLVEVDTGASHRHPPLRVWAESEAAAHAVLSREVLWRLAAFMGEQPHNWQLVWDEKGIVGAIAAPPSTFTAHLFSPLPTAEQALGEVNRVQAALGLIDALTAGRALTPRALSDFEGTYEVLVREEAIAGAPSPAAARAAALTQACEAGLAIDDWGDRLEIRYRWSTGVVFNATFVLIWVWVAAEIAGLAGGWPGWGQRLTSLAELAGRWVPGASGVPAWLVGWYPWSTLILASTCLVPWWELLGTTVRRAAISRSEVKMVRGLIGRQQQRGLAGDDDVQVTHQGTVRVASATVSPRLPPQAAAALARLLAVDGGRRLTLPPVKGGWRRGVGRPPGFAP
jgi:hypothetical protein